MASSTTNRQGWVLGRWMSEQGKNLVDVGSFAIVGATLIEWLPAAAAILSIIWTIIRLLETETVRRWKKTIKRIKRLKMIMISSAGAVIALMAGLLWKI